MQKHNEGYCHLIVSLSRMQRRTYRVSKVLLHSLFHPLFWNSAVLTNRKSTPQPDRQPIQLYFTVFSKSSHFLGYHHTDGNGSKPMYRSEISKYTCTKKLTPSVS